ncbi:hypothetical protein BKA56DRAFT_64343 [Ilyonectria sp. MPI-CAGE-AT-0026]|nr:hypothetical protein BKA56DRAFT_64343 [Ilyonectria sp. MPI-CAGE-AT-0026]
MRCMAPTVIISQLPLAEAGSCTQSICTETCSWLGRPGEKVLHSSTRGVICRYHATRLGPALACLGAYSYALLLCYHFWLLRMSVSSWARLEASPSSVAKWQIYGWNYGGPFKSLIHKK